MSTDTRREIRELLKDQKNVFLNADGWLLYVNYDSNRLNPYYVSIWREDIGCYELMHLCPSITALFRELNYWYADIEVHI